MEDFNKRFAEAMAMAGITVKNENGSRMNQEELTEYLNRHNLYEVDGNWYTYDSIFQSGEMQDYYKARFKGNYVTADNLTFYMLNDCNVSGLCIAEYNGKYGIFPLMEVNGSQDGIWCCEGEPFIYEDVSVYADWNHWDDYGYVVANKDGKWGVIKVIQFPEPSAELSVPFIFSDPEEAIRATGEEFIPDTEPYFKEI